MRRERLIRPTGTVLFVGLIRCVKRRIRHYGAVAGCGMMNCTPNVGHNLTSEGAVYETFI
ncbi:hypothetical protein C1N95_018270 [Escherichia coli]|nr:hypothetical protein C1N95_018270 [Escherichia coli]